jgi:hypothetical protein
MDNQNVQMVGQQNVKQVNIHHITEKLHSKKEIYNFLTLDCKIHLPSLRSTNVYFYKQILRGEKKVSMKTITYSVNSQSIERRLRFLRSLIKMDSLSKIY